MAGKLHGKTFWSRAASGRTKDLKLTITRCPQPLLPFNTSPKELGYTEWTIQRKRASETGKGGVELFD